jgi:hypothetical protein
MEQQLNRIAMFPLNIIVLPGEEVPLRIFEPRYKQLIAECREHSLPFGIPYMKDGVMTSIGSEVEISEVIARNSFNDMVIMIRGKSLFQTINFFTVLPSKPYGGGIIEIIFEDFITTNSKIRDLTQRLRLISSHETSLIIGNENFSMLSIAKKLMLKSEEKYKFLVLNTNEQKEKFLIKQLDFLELIQSQEKILDKNFQLN